MHAVGCCLDVVTVSKYFAATIVCYSDCQFGLLCVLHMHIFDQKNDGE